jgi:quercetin dioxygenase-like cupin family protein
MNAAKAPLEILIHSDVEGEPFWFLDALSIVRLSGAQTGGTFSLIEDRVPAGRATPFHVHRREDETFYVLEGEFSFFDGKRKIRGGPGTTVFLPRDIPHGFRSETAGRLLILATPSGFDRFVAEAGVPAPRWELPAPASPDFAKLTEIAAKYAIEILGPLPD